MLTSPVEYTRNESVTVGVTSSIISEARNIHRPRSVICVRNISTSTTAVITVTLGFTQAVANQGIVLREGEFFVDTSEGGYQCYQGMISAISNEAASTLAIYEK